MIDYTPATIRMLSMLGQRGVLGYTLHDLGSTRSDIVALSADLCNTSGLDRFLAAYPDRVINVGIAEQNMIGVAAGLADQGYVPFATTFANFATMRACEWVRHFMGYMKCNVKLVGFGAGFAMELFGNTHYGIEDIAAIRSIPNITIFSPADGLEVAKCVYAAAESKEPTYIRLSGKMNNPIIHKRNIVFEPGKMIRLREGKEISIFATGSMVSIGMNACSLLEEDNIDCSLYDVHTIKPIDKMLPEYTKGKKLIVTAEEHSVVGGLGSTVAEEISNYRNTPPLLRLGIEVGYKKAGDYQYMLDQNRLNARNMAEDIKKRIKEISYDESGEV